MDRILHSHQAAVAERQLQLERVLAQKHAELRERTQEIEDTLIELAKTRKRGNEQEQITESLRESNKALIKKKDIEINSKVCLCTYTDNRILSYIVHNIVCQKQ